MREKKTWKGGIGGCYIQMAQEDECIGIMISYVQGGYRLPFLLGSSLSSSAQIEAGLALLISKSKGPVMKEHFF